MTDWVRGCLARVGCLTLLVAGVTVGWMYRDDVAAWWEARAPAPVTVEPSEEAARRAERRIDRVLQSGSGGEVVLDPTELQSLVRYRVAPRLRPGVSRPAVTLRDSTLEVTATLDLVRLMGDELPEMVRGVLGDTTRVTAALRPDVPAPGRLRLRVEEVRAGAVRVPSVMVPWLLRELRLPVARDDARAVELAVGLGLTAARVGEDGLVLVRRGGA